VTRRRSDQVAVKNRALGSRTYYFPRASLNDCLLCYMGMTSRSAVKHTFVRMIQAEMIPESEEQTKSLEYDVKKKSVGINF